MKEGPSRRWLLKAGAAAVAVGAGAHFLEKAREEASGERLDPAAEPDFDSNPESSEAWEPKEVDTGYLAGQPMRGMFADYLGVPRGTIVPERMRISFPQVLKDLWRRKIDLSRDGPDASRTPDVGGERVLSYARRANFEHHKRAFERQGITTPDQALDILFLPELIDRLDRRLESMKQAMRSGAMHRELARAYGSALGAHLDLFSSLADRLEGKSLLAYSMTELLPSANGVFNAEYYDFLLQNAGGEFVANIPSLGDSILSFGALQFTKYGFAPRKAAVLMNSAFPESIRLDSAHLDDLYSIEDQMIAGYLYALNILARAVSQLAISEHATRRPHLKVLATIDDQTLLGFIATSHNSPTEAFRALQSWISDREHLHERPSRFGRSRKRHHEEPAQHPRPFSECCGTRIREYCDKTEHNFKGIGAYMRTAYERR